MLCKVRPCAKPKTADRLLGISATRAATTKGRRGWPEMLVGIFASNNETVVGCVVFGAAEVGS